MGPKEVNTTRVGSGYTVRTTRLVYKYPCPVPMTFCPNSIAIEISPNFSKFPAFWQTLAILPIHWTPEKWQKKRDQNLVQRWLPFPANSPVRFDLRSKVWTIPTPIRFSKNSATYVHMLVYSYPVNARFFLCVCVCVIVFFPDWLMILDYCKTRSLILWCTWFACMLVEIQFVSCLFGLEVVWFRVLNFYTSRED